MPAVDALVTGLATAVPGVVGDVGLVGAVGVVTVAASSLPPPQADSSSAVPMHTAVH
jgi:hypothetical protein